MRPSNLLCVFFFNDTATTEIYTLSLHDALPISGSAATGTATPSSRTTSPVVPCSRTASPACDATASGSPICCARSEEHTAEIPSQSKIRFPLLLEKKKNTHTRAPYADDAAVPRG